MFDPFQNQLKKVTAKYNLARTFKAIEICQEYRNLAPEIIREDALKNSFPKSYKDNTLTIGVMNSVWAQEVVMKKHLIQEAINKKFGEKTILKLRIEMCERIP